MLFGQTKYLLWDVRELVVRRSRDDRSIQSGANPFACELCVRDTYAVNGTTECSGVRHMRTTLVTQPGVVDT